MGIGTTMIPVQKGAMEHVWLRDAVAVDGDEGNQLKELERKKTRIGRAGGLTK